MYEAGAKGGLEAAFYRKAWKKKQIIMICLVPEGIETPAS
jgi:hypothetical protein